MSVSKITFALMVVCLALPRVAHSQIKLQTPNVETILYLGPGRHQPLVVGIGGSEGGNAWASDYWASTRQQFLDSGYAFVAIGYFGCEGTPPLLDRIGIDHVYQAVMEAARNERVDKNRIALIGGSRGADLALLLGSYYADISCVVGLSASHVVFPGHTQRLTTSSWTFEGRELPFVPVNEAAIPFLMIRNLRSAFEAMLMDTIAEQNARIPVEKIKGPVLLLSASDDEIIPAVEMGEKMMASLEANRFPYPCKHIVLSGPHAEPTRHFDLVFDFLKQHFLRE